MSDNTMPNAAAEPFLTLPGGGTVILSRITETCIDIHDCRLSVISKNIIPAQYNFCIYTDVKQGPTIVKFSRKSEVLLFADKLNRLRATVAPVIHWHEL